MLGLFVYISSFFYVHACCIMTTWWGEPGKIVSYVDD